MLAIWLAACGPDPVIEAAREELAREGGMEAPPPAAGALPPAAGAPPPAAGAPPPAAGARSPSGLVGPPPEAARLRLRGRVVGVPPGTPVFVDVFDGDQDRRDGPRPALLARGRAAADGSFEVAVPPVPGPVHVQAFADRDGDGRPSPGDLPGRCEDNPVALGEGGAAGLVVRLESP